MSRFLGLGARMFREAGRRIPGVAVAVAVHFVPFVHAGEPGEIVFAVPDTGRVSLGVFDGDGRLVRVLHRLAPEGDFRVGLNGYITRWDGLDDHGRRLPRGSYEVRGYLVGGVDVSGADFHFNDWAGDAAAPDIRKISDFSLLENGDVVLLAGDRLGGGLLARFSPEKGFVWSVGIKWSGRFSGGNIFRKFLQADSAPLLASNSKEALVITGGGTRGYALGDGKKKISIPPAGCAAPLALAANDSEMFVSAPGGTASIALGDLARERISFPPAVFTSLDADATRLLGASPDGVWLQQGGGRFEKIAFPAEVSSLSLGVGESFWFVGSEPGSSGRLVGQAAFSGEILRTLRGEPGGPRPDKVRASRTGEKFAVLESRAGLQRLRVMARCAGGWTIEWESAREDSTRFGFAGDNLTADAGATPQTREMKILLGENPLTGRRSSLVLRAVCDRAGSRLVSADGLDLVDISARRDMTRVVLHRGKTPDSIRFLQGNGTVVEEFDVTGLRRIFALDAGQVKIP